MTTVPRLHSAPQRRRSRPGTQRGFTLAEILVAIAVFAVISAIALTLYDQLQKSFKQGENAAFQQQNTRIAFDRMVADLRMAGFNYNPDGDGLRPDEQIEGMWANALTIRGDFDFETADAASPESTLGGSGMTFGIVSIGNDEIVTYALGKPSGAGGTTLTFDADVSAVPRDGTVETVQLPNVYTDMNSPPYTLYRITLKPGGTPLSSIADKVPIADDVRSLEFTYYDAAGNVITTMAGGADTTANIAARKEIARVNVSIVGMTKDPDLAYLDPADTNPASRNYRKFELSSDVTPRNLGFVGVPDLDLNDPTTPTGLAVCPGHCKGLRVTWNANPPQDNVVKYQVSYGPSILNQGFDDDVFATNHYLDNLAMGSAYVVSVSAVDGAGNESDPRAYSSPITVQNTTTPEPPASLTATNISAATAVPNQIDLSWPRPVKNTTPTALACDGAPNTPVRDLLGYRLYRGATSTFDPNIPAQVQLSWDPNQLPGAMGAPAFSDNSVINCRTYYYKVLAEDKCGLQSSPFTAGSGEADTSVPPSAPINVQAINLGLGSALITWDPVNLDTSSPRAPIVIDTYKVWGAVVQQSTDPNLATYNLIYDGPVASISTPSYTDSAMPSPPLGFDYYYRVSAKDDCPNESAMSLPALVTTCSFGGTVTLSMSPGGNPVGGNQTIDVTVSGTPVMRGQIRVVDDNTGAVILNQSFSSPPYTTTWNVTSTATVGHTYTVIGAAEDPTGCVGTDSISGLGVVPVAPCCIVVSNPTVTNNTTLGNISGSTKNNQVGFDIESLCTFPVDIIGLEVDWVDNTPSVCGSSPANPQLAAWTITGFPDVVLSPETNPSSGTTTPLSIFDLTVSPFTVYPMSPGVPRTQTFVFTKDMAFKCGNKVGVNDIGIFYETSDGQTCFISVIPDASNPSLTLCDVNLDPNCP